MLLTFPATVASNANVTLSEDFQISLVVPFGTGFVHSKIVLSDAEASSKSGLVGADGATPPLNH